METNGHSTDTSESLHNYPAILPLNDSPFGREITWDTTLFAGMPHSEQPGKFLTPPSAEIGFTLGALSYTFVFLALLAFIRLRGDGILSALYLFFFKRKKQEEVHAEVIRPNYFSFSLLLCMSFSVQGLLLSYLLHGEFSFQMSALYFAGLWVYQLMFIGLVRLLGWIYQSRYCAHEVTINLWTYSLILGLSLSPGVLALFFVQPDARTNVLYLLAAIFTICLLLRFARLIKILFECKVSIFYMILYLCALEILPLLVIYKLVAGNMGIGIN